jgi:hypothetical protein
VALYASSGRAIIRACSEPDRRAHQEDRPLDTWQLCLALLFSTVGFSYFLYGKKRNMLPFMLAGAALMGFGYFVETPWLLGLIGVALTALPFFWRG